MLEGKCQPLVTPVGFGVYSTHHLQAGNEYPSAIAANMFLYIYIQSTQPKKCRSISLRQLPMTRLFGRATLHIPVWRSVYRRSAILCPDFLSLPLNTIPMQFTFSSAVNVSLASCHYHSVLHIEVTHGYLYVQGVTPGCDLVTVSV